MRKLLTIMMAGLLVLAVAVPAMAQPGKGRGNGNGKGAPIGSQFQDWQPDFWANEALSRMAVRGILKGDDLGNLGPHKFVTRLEAAVTLSRLLGLKAPATGDTQSLEDAADIPAWGKDAVLIGLKEGFLIQDGKRLNPMKPMSRLDAAIMLAKAAAIRNSATAAGESSALPFKDAGQIPEALRGYVVEALDDGLIQGFEDHTFQPNKLVTRAEWAMMLFRFDQGLGLPETPDRQQVRGTVTAVDAAALTVTVATATHPQGVAYQVDESAAVYDQGRPIGLDQIRTGDQVILNLNTDGIVVLISLLHSGDVTTTVTGTVSAITLPTATADGSLVLNVGSASSRYELPAGANIPVTVGRFAMTLAAIVPGDQATLTLVGSAVRKIAVQVATDVIVGKVTAVHPASGSSPASIRVTDLNGVVADYTVTDQTTIKTWEGQSLTLAGLNVTDQVRLEAQRSMLISVTRL